jgi:hypothetical protein
MGPYCQYCNNRCFLPRIVGDRSIILATCPSGMANDRAKLGGHDHRTALNPVTGTIDIKVTVVTRATPRVCEHPHCVRVKDDGQAAEVIAAGDQFAHVTFLTDGHNVPQRLHPECLTDLHRLTTEVAAAVSVEATHVPPVRPRAKLRTNTLRGKRCAHEQCTDQIDQGETYAALTVPGKGTSAFHLECAQIQTGMTIAELQAQPA